MEDISLPVNHSDGNIKTVSTDDYFVIEQTSFSVIQAMQTVDVICAQNETHTEGIDTVLHVKSENVVNVTHDAETKDMDNVTLAIESADCMSHKTDNVVSVTGDTQFQSTENVVSVTGDTQFQSSDLCDSLATGDQLNIIVGEEVNGLTPEEQGAWAVASQDLPGCYIYHCGGSTYRVAAYSDDVPVPKPVAEVYTCEIRGCGRQFSALGYLKIHQLIHTGQKNTLICPYADCGRIFSWPAHLKYHQLTHIGKRSYACSYEGCGKSFYTSQRLMVHTRLHTGERPFVCRIDSCKKSFTTAGNLKNHARIHSGQTSSGVNVTNSGVNVTNISGEKPFACDFERCTKRFTEYSSLRKHRVIHSGEKPFQCEECGQPFTQSSSRNVHMRRHHPSILTAIVRLTGDLTQPVATLSNDIIPGAMATSDNLQSVSLVASNIVQATHEPIVKGTDGIRQPLEILDEVVTISSQPITKGYQDNVHLSETMLNSQDDVMMESVVVQTEIMNPEVTLSSSAANVAILSQTQDMVSMATDYHDSVDTTQEQVVYECDLLATRLQS